MKTQHVIRLEAEREKLLGRLKGLRELSLWQNGKEKKK